MGQRSEEPASDTTPSRPYVWEPSDAVPDLVDHDGPQTFDQPQVNLRVAAVEGVPEIWVPGRRSSIVVTLENDGIHPSPSTSVGLHLVPENPDVPTVEVGRLLLPGLGPRSTFTIEEAIALPPWSPSTTFAFEAHVDPDDVVAETREDDNVWFGRALEVNEVIVQPQFVEFDVVQTGCRETRIVRIENRSEERILLAGVSVVGDPAYRLSGPLTPRSLSPASDPFGVSKATYQLHLEPDAPGDLGAFLEVRTSEQLDNAVYIPISARAEEQPTHVEPRAQPPGPIVDVLLVVDRSVSMNVELGELDTFLPQWISTLKTTSTQFEIGVISADAGDGRGQLIGSPVSSEAVDPVRDLSEKLDLLATETDFDNTSFEAARLSMLHHRGWLREDAALSIVFLSDRDDQSAEPVGFYAEALRTAKADVRQIVVNAIVLDGSSRCLDQPPADRYLEMIGSFNGTTSAICDVDAYQPLWWRPFSSFGLPHEFKLDRTPRPETLTVRVDGVLEPPVDSRGREIWRHDRWSNVVTFSLEDAPRAGSLINFEYVPVCR